MHSREQYLETLREEYRRASKKEKSRRGSSKIRLPGLWSCRDRRGRGDYPSGRARDMNCPQTIFKPCGLRVALSRAVPGPQIRELVETRIDRSLE